MFAPQFVIPIAVGMAGAIAPPRMGGDRHEPVPEHLTDNGWSISRVPTVDRFLEVR
jgi:hypothetical protein